MFIKIDCTNDWLKGSISYKVFHFFHDLLHLHRSYHLTLRAFDFLFVLKIHCCSVIMNSVITSTLPKITNISAPIFHLLHKSMLKRTPVITNKLFVTPSLTVLGCIIASLIFSRFLAYVIVLFFVTLHLILNRCKIPCYLFYTLIYASQYVKRFP